MTNENEREIAELEARLHKLRALESAAATPCPEIAQKPSKHGFKARWFVGAFAGLIVGALILGIAQESQKAESDLASLKAAIADSDALIERLNGPDVGELKERWSYDEHINSLTDERTYQACIYSKENVRQQRPYETIPAVLCLRQKQSNDIDVYIYLKGQGQILSRRESVKVRFDANNIEIFGATSAADGSTNVIFLNNESRFLRGVREADATRVEITIYNSGNQIVEFVTAGLEWPPNQ